MAALINDAVRRFLEGPGGLVIGAIGPDGRPHAAYAWGLQVSPDGSTLRVIAEAGPTFSLATSMAITCADVRTLRTLQVKGVIRTTEPPTPEDRYVAKLHTQAFIDEVVAVDNFRRETMEGYPSVDYDVYTVEVDEVFDQSPGPNAGSVVDLDRWSEP